MIQRVSTKEKKKRSPENKALKEAVITARPLIGVLGASGANAYANEVHGHASPIEMNATHMCNGCTTYKMQSGRCRGNYGHRRADAVCVSVIMFKQSDAGRVASALHSNQMARA
ncbi:hypothetical protein EVAR_31343_1 [Eumeta japonica]|uniref:Uncharacterized protein n=1 Tax=Eumeta variegata TaxID=151549 RepID=A0A4C1XYW9_EUMVA|nr:hypothetical protein EVAR_31343_1 [Eumeta japonica]